MARLTSRVSHLLSSQYPEVQFPCCIGLASVGHTVTHEVILLVQSAPIVQNFSVGQLLRACASTSCDDNSVDRMKNTRNEHTNDVVTPAISVLLVSATNKSTKC